MNLFSQDPDRVRADALRDPHGRHQIEALKIYIRLYLREITMLFFQAVQAEQGDG